MLGPLTTKQPHMLHVVIAVATFTPPVPQVSARSVVPRAGSPVAIGGFKMPEMPSMPDFGGGGNEKLQLFPDDVQFTDVDGDTVTIRPLGGKKVDFFVNGKIRLSKAILVQNGNMLEITGTITKGTPFSIIGFNLEDIVTEGTTPKDPADVEKAMKCAQ